MTGKQALVVDDSKSARVVLRKMLEKHALNVETADSAEEAIDFLSRHAPDVIFMDHLMPGMDGFQAIEQIKKNPSTAMIPIVMYTSQDGEVYVGQARALGAVDVLTKDIRPTQLKNVLTRLSLLDNGQLHDVKREAAHPPPTQKRIPNQVRINLSDSTIQRLARETSDLVNTSPQGNNQVSELDSLLEEQRLNLRQDILSANRNTQKSLGHHLQSLEANLAYLKDLVESDKDAIPKGGRSNLGWVLALGSSIALAWIIGNQMQTPSRSEAVETSSNTAAALEQLQAQNDALEVAFENLGLDGNRSGNMALLPAIEWAINLSGMYAYTTVPLDDSQLLKLRVLIDELQESGFSGVVNVNVYLGRFCLQRNVSDQLVVAASDAKLKDCELLGFSQEDAQTISLNQSINFANYITSTQFDGDNPIELAIAPYGNSSPKIAYPDPEKVELAGDWNKFAQQNNRIEYELTSDSGLQ